MLCKKGLFFSSSCLSLSLNERQEDEKKRRSPGLPLQSMQADLAKRLFAIGKFSAYPSGRLPHGSVRLYLPW